MSDLKTVKLYLYPCVNVTKYEEQLVLLLNVSYTSEMPSWGLNT